MPGTGRPKPATVLDALAELCKQVLIDPADCRPVDLAIGQMTFLPRQTRCIVFCAGQDASENGGAGMFEMFTDRARRVVVLAQEEARLLAHNYIGTEHLLLGLVREGHGQAAQVLESLGVSLQAVRQQVQEIIGRGQQDPSGHIPFTPRAKKVLELAQREAIDLDDGFIDTEHLLLGLVLEGKGVAAQVLVRLGADLHSVRQQVIQLAPGRAERAAISVASRARKRGRAKVVGDALEWMPVVEHRLAAIERWIGMAPALDDLNREITHLRQQRQAAANSQDYETAATLRDKEKELLASKDSQEREWATTGHRSLAEELARVSSEVERLRAVLRQHGIEQADDTA